MNVSGIGYVKPNMTKHTQTETRADQLRMSERPRTKAQKRKRISIITSELVRMSKDGWKNAKSYDYEPLEAELNKLRDELNP